MQVTVDIPEPLYLALNGLAHSRHSSIEDILLKQAMDLCEKETPLVSSELPHVHLPLVTTGEPGPLLRKGVNLNEYALLTDDEWEQLERDLT